jgi:acyl-CoA synthetase (AMP-forming)/AMP-acid ligase II
MLFSGYLDDEAATTAVLDEAGWLHTADRGSLDEAGRLVVLGRGDDVIIRGGENIAPGEVEAAIAAHPEVAEVGVVGVADARWGQVPVAAVVPVAGAELSDAELRGHARARLAGFKVPARFVLVDTLPRSTIGKVARPELHRLVLTTPSTMTVKGMPSCCSSQAVRRAPCRRGRVSST